MHTLLPLEITFPLLLVSIAGGYTLVHKHPKIKKNAYTRTLFAFVLVPGAYQFLFVINFLFAGNPSTETYRYRLKTTKTYTNRHSKPRIDKTPILQLENDAYDKYLGIRFLWSPEKMRFGRYIEYHFYEGLLGVRVMKSYNIIDKL
jgi:hypothetical protein